MTQSTPNNPTMTNDDALLMFAAMTPDEQRAVLDGVLRQLATLPSYPAEIIEQFEELLADLE